MKLTAARAELAEAVKWANAAVSVRPNRPALAGLRLTATKDSLTIVGHDFDQVHSVTIAAEVETPGVLVPVGMMLRDLLAVMKGDRIALAVDKRGMSVKAGRSAYTVSCFDLKDWAEFPKDALEDRGAVDADELRRCLVLAGAVTNDENAVTRLRGVRLEATADELAVVGLQSSQAGVAYAKWAGADFAAQVPAKNLGAAIRGMSGPVAVTSSESALNLADESHSVTLRAFADPDAYPQWRQLLTPGPQVIKVEAELLRDAVRRAAIATGPKVGEAKGQARVIETAIAGGVIELSAGGESAKGTESVDCTGEGTYSASWTAEVLLAVLGTLPSAEVTLSFGAAEGSSSLNPPMLITDDDGSFTAVIMPRKRAA